MWGLMKNFRRNARQCPVCGSESRVYDSRDGTGTLTRWRKCVQCDNERWKTEEVVVKDLTADQVAKLALTALDAAAAAIVQARKAMVTHQQHEASSTSSSADGASFRADGGNSFSEAATRAAR